MKKPTKKPAYYRYPHSGHTTVAFVNPLIWPALDPDVAEKRRLVADETSALGFFCVPPGKEPDLTEMMTRYREIHEAEPSEGDFVFPNETTINEKIVWPLRQAKACYIVENYLGTIALASLIAEMVAILMFELSRPTQNGQPLMEDAERRIFGDRFQDLGQHRRVEILSAYGLIGKAEEEAFRQVIGTRRKHLHHFSAVAPLASDARNMYRHALLLAESALAPEDPSRPYTVRASLRAYLAGKGAPVPIEPTTTATEWTRINPDGSPGEKVIAHPPAPLRPRRAKKR